MEYGPIKRVLILWKLTIITVSVLAFSNTTILFYIKANSLNCVIGIALL